MRAMVQKAESGAADLRFCTDRALLLDLLTSATGEYARLARNLSSEMARMSCLEYRRKLAEVDDMRMVAEHALNALLGHREEHGC